MDAVSETVLVERLKGGDAAALETLMERYASRVFRVARGITRTDADAEEVVQDVFLTLARKIDGFEGHAALGTWIYRVTTNAALLTEPMLFYLPFGKRPDAQSSPERQPLKHAAGLREITRVELMFPQADRPSSEWSTMMNVGGLVQIHGGTENLVELGFDGESQGKEMDFRPALPLLFRW